MTKTTIKRKKIGKIKTPVRALQKRAEELWKEVCALKYGKFCWVQRYHPEIKVTHTDTIQIDHCITRANKYFFFDVWNGTPVCSGCNMAKCYDNKSVARAIDEMVEKRNPAWYKDAIWLDQTGEPNINFSKIWWLEEKITDLENELATLKKG